jgi:hypothetical protein
MAIFEFSRSLAVGANSTAPCRHNGDLCESTFGST